MPQRQPMSRQEFLDKVDQLLGKFDSDAYMHGFNSGVSRVCDVLKRWADEEFSQTSEVRKLLVQKIAQVRKTRR